MNGFYQIHTRRIADTEAAETSSIDRSVAGAFDIPGAMSRYCVALAMGFVSVNIATPFQYVPMLGSVLVGYLLFGHLPDALTWLGGAIVIASGLYVGWTQTRR